MAIIDAEIASTSLNVWMDSIRNEIQEETAEDKLMLSATTMIDELA